jgi:hypothetical protein
MLNDSFWFAMGVAATLVSAFVAQRVGRIQISLMQRSHELNVKLASCKIGTDVKIDRRAPNASRPDIRRWFLVTTIYNEGDCAAKQIEGNWNLSCFDPSQNRLMPISIDFLGATKVELPLQHLGDTAITQAQSSGEFWVNVDIQFSYLGLDENTPEHYTAKYQYNKQQRQMEKEIHK